MSRAKISVENAVAALPRNKKFLLAVSGGIDSVALFHAMLARAHASAWTIEVAHVDHALRRSSKRDATFVKKLCEAHKVTFHTIRLRPPVKLTNLEQWGREKRYAYFAKLLKSRKLDYVLTAHQANDVAETFLMRLVTNKELHSIAHQLESRKCVRPLLLVTRTEIERFVSQHQYPHVEDPTNAKTDFLRNWVRKELIPLIASRPESGGAIALSIRALAVAEDLEFLMGLVEPRYEQISQFQFAGKEWKRALKIELSKTPVPLQWRLARRAMKPKLGFNLGREHCQGLVNFFLGLQQAVQLPTGLRIINKNGGIELIPATKRPK